MCVSDHSLIGVDLNRDGKNDFSIGEGTFSTYLGMQVAMLSVIGDRTGNAVAAHFGLGYYAASALAPGVRVGPTITTHHGPQVMAYEYFFTGSKAPWCRGPWDNVQRRYLGLKFVIKGKTHFGWARLNVKAKCNLPFRGQLTAVLTGYAYETIPGKSIKAGQTKDAPDDFTNSDFAPGASLINPIPSTPHPAALGALALGAQGIPLWRRKED